MTRLKILARLLPPPLRSPVRAIWRQWKGNVEFHVLGVLADKDKIALDVGANCGVYTVVLARQAKACVAFEPNPPMAAATTQLASREGLNNVQVQSCALSDQETEVTFRVPIVNGEEVAALATIEGENQLDGAHVRTYTVPCRRLDSFELDAVGLIKIDAEGHETAILDGATKLIERDLPAVMIEVEERHKKGSVAYVQQFFQDRGYKSYFLIGRQLRPFDQFDPAKHQDPSSIQAEKVHFDAVYVNNFIFAADSRRIALLDKISSTGRSF